MGLEFYVDLHIGVDETISVRSGHSICARGEGRYPADRIARIADVLVHIEPARPVRATNQELSVTRRAAAITVRALPGNRISATHSDDTGR